MPDFDCRHWKSNDRIYTPLPLYHSSGLFLCVTAAWTVGATVVLSRKFSVRKFWQEVRESDATVVQYIGKLSTYPASGDVAESRTRRALPVLDDSRRV